MVCSKCKGEFQLRPGKPGYANVCPSCVESPQAHAERFAREERLHKEWARAEREHSRQIERTARSKRIMDSLGFEIEGKPFIVRVPR